MVVVEVPSTAPALVAIYRDEQQPNGVLPDIIPTGGLGYGTANGNNHISTDQVNQLLSALLDVQDLNMDTVSYTHLLRQLRHGICRTSLAVSALRIMRYCLIITGRCTLG